MICVFVHAAFFDMKIPLFVYLFSIAVEIDRMLSLHLNALSENRINVTGYFAIFIFVNYYIIHTCVGDL